jgi:TonB-dependent receptor
MESPERTGPIRSVSSSIVSAARMGLALAAIAAAVPDVGEAQAVGNITGVVMDANGQRLNSATVEVAGTSLRSLTDVVGQYRIAGVPIGPQTITVRSLGYAETRLQTTIRSGETTRQDLVIDLDPVLLEGLVIEGQLGQSEAFYRQRTAASIQNVVSGEQIERFPDSNVPGVLRRIPGVAAESDRGEPGAVYLRGLNPDLTSVTVNGQRLAATGSGRASSLSGISAEMLESLEVVKAVTPDMDAEAIAGSINLRTRQPTRRQLDGRVEGGLHSLAAGGNGRAALFYANQFDRLGLVVGTDYSKQNRETENVQTAWGTFDGQQVLNRLTVQSYPMERTRYSLNTTLDYDLGEGSHLFARGLASLYETYERRHTLAYRLDAGERVSAAEIRGGRFEREGRYTFNEQHVYNLNVGGVHRFPSLTLDYDVAGGMANGNQPFRDYFTYRMNGADLRADVSTSRFFPEVAVTNSADPLSPGGFELEKFEERTNLRSDRNLAGNLNLEIPFTLALGSGSVKIGAKHLRRSKENDEELVEFYPVGSTFYMDQVGATAAAYRRNVSRGGYPLGRVVDFERGYTFANANRGVLEDDINASRMDGDSNDYLAREAVSAGFAMASMNIGRLTVLGGVRYEHTSNDYSGNRLTFDSNGDYVSTEPVRSASAYGSLFPSAHLRFAATEATNLRLSYTGTIARPSFGQLAPNEVVENENQRVRRGNPELLPARSRNLDLLGEHYFRSIGVLSAGVFLKQIDDFTFSSTAPISTGEYAGYELVTPANGAEATVYGAELGWQQQLAFLPAPFDGTGILANYTYTGSTTELGDRFDRPNTRFPRQVPHFGNLALSYDRLGFSGLVSLNYQSAFMYSIGRTPDLDRFTHKRAQFDLAASQQLTPRFRAFLEMNNLTNEPFLTYTGSLDRPIESEYEGRWGTFGVRFEF